MSFTRVIYTVVIILVLGSLTGFKSTAVSPLETNNHSLMLTDTLPDEMAERVLKMNAKREEIRTEVARIKMEQEEYARKREAARQIDEVRKAKKTAKEIKKTKPPVTNSAALAEQARLEQEAAEKAQRKAAEQEARRIAKAEKKAEREAIALAKKEAELAASAQPQVDEAEQARLEQEAAEKARQKAADQEAKRIAKAEKKAEREAVREAALLAENQARIAAAKAALENKQVEVSAPTIPEESPEEQRIKAESVSLPGKANTPPSPATSSEEDKTKKAVAKAMAKKKKKNKKGGNSPKISSSSSKSSKGKVDLGSCKFSFNEVDPFTQRTKRKLEDRFFFSYTEEKLKVYMEGEDYLTCNGSLSDIQGIMALNLTFIINSPYARQEYGSIGTGTQLIFRMIDGETLPLLSEQSDSGIYNRHTGKTIYKTLFLIGPKDEKTLRRKEISEVRMVWGTGYEDYQINELDFLIDQFHCIDAARN